METAKYLTEMVVHARLVHIFLAVAAKYVHLDVRNALPIPAMSVSRGGMYLTAHALPVLLTVSPASHQQTVFSVSSATP